MTKKQYTFYRIITIILLVLIISFSFSIKNIYIAVLSMLIAMTVLLELRKKITDVMYDERDLQISGKALRLATNIFCITAAILSIIFMWLNPIYSNFYNIGLTLSLSVCSFLILYNFLYVYFNKK